MGILHCLLSYITNYYYVLFIDLLLIVSVVDCKEPADVSFGEFQFTNTTYGSTASLLCHSGYRVNDTEKVMTCADKGQWVNKLSCLSKSLSLFLSPLGPLLPPRGARVWGGGTLSRLYIFKLETSLGNRAVVLLKVCSADFRS